jgi:hypothetical protein
MFPSVLLQWLADFYNGGTLRYESFGEAPQVSVRHTIKYPVCVYCVLLSFPQVKGHRMFTIDLTVPY